MARHILWVFAVVSIMSSSFGLPKPQPDGEDAGGSRCPGVTCVTAPGGTTCQARYDPSDKCCPTWVCANGQTAHGSMMSQSNSWKSSDGSSHAYSSGSGFEGSASGSQPWSMSSGGRAQQSFSSFGQPFKFGQNPGGNIGSNFGMSPFGSLFGAPGTPNIPSFNGMSFGFGSMGRNAIPAINNAVDVLGEEQVAEIV